MIIDFDLTSTDDYATFLKVKQLPRYTIRGRRAQVPDEYSHLFGQRRKTDKIRYRPSEWLWDYQKDICRLAIRKQKFAIFADCGLGKTPMFLEFARHAVQSGGILIFSPLNVVHQTVAESHRFYGTSPEVIPSSDLSEWLKTCAGKIGITNYEALKHEGLETGQLGGMILDESSMLKSHYGKYGTELIRLGRGLQWKLCCTGTPAPNDRIEFANHAVFLDRYPTVNSFLATYFINRGQTNERWELKPHALRPFYRALSDWCIFLTNPSTYGWRDNCESIPPIFAHVHHVDLTAEQRRLMHNLTGQLFANDLGGITTRSAFGQISKGHYRGEQIPTNKPAAIVDLVDSWPEESTIIWCIYNEEQRELERVFPEAASITGATKHDRRIQLISDFQSGSRRVLISKPKILGFGLNLQIATRQIFSGLQDSYESYYQAVKRSNRYGSTQPLNVHIPVTELEEPMVANVLRKAHRVQMDTEEQEQLFKEMSLV